MELYEFVLEAIWILIWTIAADLLPFIGREEGETCVGIGEIGVDECEIDPCHNRHCFAEGIGAADEEGDIIGRAEGHCFLYGCSFFGTFRLEIRISGEDDVSAAGERTAWEGEPGGAAHDYGVSHSEGLETLQVGADVPGHIAVLTDGTVAGHGHYRAYLSAFFLLKAFRGQYFNPRAVHALGSLCIGREGDAYFHNMSDL